MDLDIEGWVEKSKPEQLEFRQAVHTILLAIASSENLKTKMIIKGGMLLAIEFKSTRFTKDIDFSTEDKVTDFDKRIFLEELNENLNMSVNILPYNLDCKIQSHKMKPNGPDATFPTLKLKIGHAYKGTAKHKSLTRKRCTSVVEIDYSFNEFNTQIDTLEFTSGQCIKAYSLADIVAEKFRAIIQQKGRDRTRRQDPYDLYFLLDQEYLHADDLKQKVLNSLLIKAESRRLEVRKESLADTEIIRRSEVDYETLADEIEEDLPPFETVYNATREFYESLPW